MKLRYKIIFYPLVAIAILAGAWSVMGIVWIATRALSGG